MEGSTRLSVEGDDGIAPCTKKVKTRLYWATPK